jgi:hypothetical protein
MSGWYVFLGIKLHLQKNAISEVQGKIKKLNKLSL